MSGRREMHVEVQNKSTEPGLTPEVLAHMVAAIRRQLYEHYAPFWQSAGVDVVTGNSPDAALVVVLDDADQAGVLGYHDVTPDGRPYARVFVRPILDNGGTLLEGPLSVSVTLSHEILELVGDPYASFWADNIDDGQQYALELCDAVEGDSYEIDGVSVSNFVGPRFFRKGDGPYDWMRKLTASFGMTDGGYQLVRSSSGDVREIFAASFPEWKRPGKTFAAARTMRRKPARRTPTLPDLSATE